MPGLTQDAIHKLREVVRTVDTLPPILLGKFDSDVDNGSTQLQVIKTTTGTPDGNGWYTGKIQDYDPSTNTWSDGDDALLKEVNGETLSNGKRYVAKLWEIDSSSGNAIWFTHIASSVSNLTVTNSFTLPLSATLVNNGDITASSCHLQYRCGDTNYTVARSDETGSSATQVQLSGTTSSSWVTVVDTGSGKNLMGQIAVYNTDSTGHYVQYVVYDWLGGSFTDWGSTGPSYSSPWYFDLSSWNGVLAPATTGLTIPYRRLIIQVKNATTAAAYAVQGVYAG